MNKVFEFLSRFPRKLTWLTLGVGVFFLAFTAGFFIAQYSYRKALGELGELRNKLVKTKSEYQKLRVDYTNLESDRNNILTQTKRYIQESNRLAETLEKYENLSKVHGVLVKRSSRLERSHAKLLKRRKELETAFEKARQSLRKLVPRERKQKVTVKKLQQKLKERVEKSPAFQQLRERVDQMISEKSQLEKRRSGEAQERADLESRLREMEIYQAKYTESLREIGRLEGAKRNMEQEQLNAPQRFKEVVQQNRILIKETAEMHYNLGVFYVQNKQFDRALEEFKKTIELNPGNFEAQYNLGLLYAEHYEKHDLAETHFREYLELAPEDLGGDWVRNYLVSHEAYDAKVSKS